MRRSIEEIMKDPESTYRQKLEAIRDYVAHELEANLCGTCLNSRLRTGDTASLVLRLKSVLDDIEALPDPNEEMDDFEQLISRQAWGPTATDLPPPALGG
jgi:hypothetical protein